jgi:hypothetical protein
LLVLVGLKATLGLLAHKEIKAILDFLALVGLKVTQGLLGLKVTQGLLGLKVTQGLLAHKEIKATLDFLATKGPLG